MLIYPKDDCLIFVSENLMDEEKDKVQSYNWTDMETIHFIYPKDNIWLTLKNIFVFLTAFLFASADATGIFHKEVTIVIKLKNGETINKEFTFTSIKEGEAFEKKLLNYLAK